MENVKSFYLKCLNIEVKEWQDKTVQSYLLAWNLHLKFSLGSSVFKTLTIFLSFSCSFQLLFSNLIAHMLVL